MIYCSQGYDIYLSKTTRLYPAVIVSAAGESVQISLEWAELKHDVIESKEELIEVIQEVSDLMR